MKNDVFSTFLKKDSDSIFASFKVLFFSQPNWSFFTETFTDIVGIAGISRYLPDVSEYYSKNCQEREILPNLTGRNYSVGIASRDFESFFTQAGTELTPQAQRA